MTYHELVEKVRTALVVKADASKIQEHIAAQVNVTGEAEGAFYIEIKEDAPNPIVEAFDYNDRDFLLTGDGEEILAVAEAEGVTGLRERVTATQYWPEDNPMYHHIPSMAQDVCAHKKTEIDFLNGAVVKLGEKHGIPTPCNRVIVNLIHIMESHYDLMF